MKKQRWHFNLNLSIIIKKKRYILTPSFDFRFIYSFYKVLFISTLKTKNYEQSEDI